VRRTESVAAARGIFKLARAADCATWHVYAAAAQVRLHFFCLLYSFVYSYSFVCSYSFVIRPDASQLELKANKDPAVARNIFELGLKKFEAEPSYIVRYATFLEEQNDDNALRVLFERALAVVPDSAEAKRNARRLCASSPSLSLRARPPRASSSA
jgi:cleavage stimulation factor subunit 3